MKKDFFDYMLEIMEKYPDVYLLMAGLGYPRVSEFMEKFPDRAFNTEASEQSTLDIAVGLAYAGKIPVCYSITPFILYRGFETIRTYIDHEKLPVILIGAGREDDYSKHDGFSHYAGDDWKLFDDKHQAGIMGNIWAFWPEDTQEMKDNIDRVIAEKHPAYINIKK